MYFVWVKRTESWLSEANILYINYGAVFAFAPLCSGALSDPQRPLLS